MAKKAGGVYKAAAFFKPLKQRDTAPRGGAFEIFTQERRREYEARFY
jgi:hypothetical protein